ncbi:MAG: hypothetical protein KIT32_04550 [Rhodocyclaceae bacterium]|nr:hypothetical protein [Rhodocyclaceae bacterium]
MNEIISGLRHRVKPFHHVAVQALQFARMGAQVRMSLPQTFAPNTQLIIGAIVMFGFRSRKKYNAAVDVKLNNEFQIQTRGNPNFPGVLKYLELIDVSWNNKASEDECALQIATLYLCGLVRHSFWDECQVISGRFGQVGPYGVERGLIRQEVWDKCVSLVKKAQREVSEREQ